MEAWEKNWVRLPLEGAYNVRELGGYPIAGGGQTRYHHFLRSDRLLTLTEADVAFLRSYGVRAVIDLRDPMEVRNEPDVSLGDDIATLNLSLLSFDMSKAEEVQAKFVDVRPGFEDFYDMILAAHDSIRGCFEFIAEQDEDACILFHCMAGKDRTGILAMLLMGLAGCDEWDCVSNYIQTRAHLSRSDWYAEDWERNREAGGANLADSPFHAAVHAWQCLEDAGGVMAFLHDTCGVSYEVLENVRARLVSA